MNKIKTKLKKKFADIFLPIANRQQLSTTNYQLPTNKGFTLIELMLVVALVVGIGAFSAPVYQSFQVKNDLDASANNLTQSLRRAQTLSQAIEGDSVWGVRVQTGSIVVFKGVSYAGRDVAYDEIFEMITAITPSGVSEVVFDKLSGLPQASGDIVLTTDNGDSKTISINSKGMVNY